MSIVRVQKNTNYVVMNKTALRDDNLSWKAKGIIAYMLSLPDDWAFYMEELMKHATDGETSFRSGFRELKKQGYVKRYPLRDENNKIIEWETIVSEVPHEENPLHGNQYVENQYVENEVLLSNDSLSNDSLSNDIYAIFTFWNEQQIIKHKEMNQKMKSSINARLKRYSVDELKKSITNYADILNSDDYYWTHKWTLQDFMKPDNVVRFTDESEPKKNFLSNKREPRERKVADF